MRSIGGETCETRAVVPLSFTGWVRAAGRANLNQLAWHCHGFVGVASLGENGTHIGYWRYDLPLAHARLL